MTHRRYKVVQYNKGNIRYLQLVVQFTDAQGVWRTNSVRSYGQVTPVGGSQAQNDISELQQYASDPGAPIPIGVVDEAIWRNYQKISQTGLPSPFNPAGVLEALGGAASDIAHLIGWIVADATGDILTKVDITQPDMGDVDKRRFIQWLSGFTLAIQRQLLAYRWRFYD